ncbi:MAG: hypothetical protein IJ242_08045 [Clostridia bacterium]|nr:hypothetical protein [Clostridia bacterium]
MKNSQSARKKIIAGIAGCLLYVIGDYLYSATGKNQTTETIGMFTKIAYLDMAAWRMWLSILCGFAGTILYYIGFHQMYELLRIHVTKPADRIWVRLFHAAFIIGTVAWTWVHAMFMTNALIFRYVYEAYGEMQTAAEIANRVLYANAPGMIIAYLLCDIGLAVIMLAMIWKGIIPLKHIGSRVLFSLFNPIMFPGVIGNLLALLPWPVNQLDHGTESSGHALVLVLGLILLENMTRNHEIQAGAFHDAA